MALRLVLALLAFLLPLCAGEIRDLEFARPGGTPLLLDASIPASSKPQPAVILVHGGGWEAGDKRTYIRPWFATLTGARIAWFSIDYRLGPAHKHPAAVEDIEAAIAFVKANAGRFGIDIRRIALMGESAGAHLAALAALRARQKVAAFVGFYGVYDVPLWAEQRGGQLPRNIAGYLPDSAAETLRDASPLTYVGRRNPPTLLIHGAADTGVPWRQSEVLCAAMKRAGAKCEVQLIDGAPHGVEAWEKVPEHQVWKTKTVEWLRFVLE